MEVRGVAVVTGASGGMGEVLCERLAQEGFRVIMACRNLSKAESIRRRIIEQTRNEAVEVRQLDLASFRSIKAFLTGMQREKIDLLLNNAGVMSGVFRLSADGFEQDLAVNYLGTVALTCGLLGRMNAGARVINTVSCTYRIGHLNEHFFESMPRNFGRFRSYATSKLGLLLFSLELDKRIKEREVSVYAVDPGVVDTGMLTMHRWFDPLTDLLFRPVVQTPQQGAETALYLALTDQEAISREGVWRKSRLRSIPRAVAKHRLRSWLWLQTGRVLREYGMVDREQGIVLCREKQPSFE